MWSWEKEDWKEKVRQLENDIRHRDRLVESLQADLDRLRKEKSEEVRADVQASTFVIDWKNMDVFSIERMGDDGKEAYTVLGYWIADSDGSKHVHEWKFYCSHEQHEKLAKEFEAQRK
jgi:hypothetical protein